jgi:hypothetical protein
VETHARLFIDYILIVSSPGLIPEGGYMLLVHEHNSLYFTATIVIQVMWHK